MSASIKKIGLVSVLLPFFLTACAQKKDAAWKGSIDREDGVEVVRNPAQPIYPEGYLRMEQELSLGGQTGPEEALLSSIRGVVVDEKERIFILDSEEAMIKVYDFQGNYVQTIGRPGQGPGELDSPLRLDLFDKTLMVVEASRRLSFFRRRESSSAVFPPKSTGFSGPGVTLEEIYGEWREGWTLRTRSMNT